MKRLANLILAGSLALAGCTSIQLEKQMQDDYDTARKAAKEDKMTCLGELLERDGYSPMLAYGTIARPTGGSEGHCWIVSGDLILDPNKGWVTKTNDWVYSEFDRFPFTNLMNKAETK